MSVIIPTYNRAGFVVDAIASCRAEVCDSLQVEIIVIDDGSTDDTALVLRGLSDRIRFFPLANNNGRNRARNIGLANATGDYVKFLDSDDVLEAGSLRMEVALALDTGADIVVSGWQSVEMAPGGSTGVIVRSDPPSMEPLIDSLLAGHAVPTSAALYSCDLVQDLRWDETLRKLDDWDWFIRAALRSKRIVGNHAVAYSWRQHPAQGVRSESMLREAIEHHVILLKLETAFDEKGILTTARRRRLAQYYYKEMRVLSLHDKQRFDWGIRHIYELDPVFVPKDEERQWWMRALCRVFGVRYTLSLHSAVKKLFRGQRVRVSST